VLRLVISFLLTSIEPQDSPTSLLLSRSIMQLRLRRFSNHRPRLIHSTVPLFPLLKNNSRHLGPFLFLSCTLVVAKSVSTVKSRIVVLV
jgi:hypothetical protein